MRITVFKECAIPQASKGAPYRIVDYPKCAYHAAWIGRVDGRKVARGLDYAEVLRVTLKRAKEVVDA